MIATLAGRLGAHFGGGHVSGSGSGSRFELWRQDDNGNRCLVSAHGDRASAESALRDMEGGVQHKQLYYVKERSRLTAAEPIDPATETPRPPR